jgi:hypothetical protein
VVVVVDEDEVEVADEENLDKVEGDKGTEEAENEVSHHT